MNVPWILWHQAQKATTTMRRERSNFNFPLYFLLQIE